MPDAPRCTAKSKRSGEQCRLLGLVRPDGTFTRHCKFHAGFNERAAPGDPIRGGRPPTSYRFAQIIRSEEDRGHFEAFMVDVTNLDRQIALAELNLLRFVRRCEQSEKGGIPTSVAGGGQSVSIESYDRIVRSYLEIIGRLRERKARIDHMDDPELPLPGGGTGDTESILADARARVRERLLRRTEE
jgi:hypothetical protein